MIWEWQVKVRCAHPKWKWRCYHSGVSNSLWPHGTVCSPPGSSVHGILQARMLEWVAIPFSRESSRPRDLTWVSHIAGRFFTVWITSSAILAFSFWLDTLKQQFSKSNPRTASRVSTRSKPYNTTGIRFVKMNATHLTIFVLKNIIFIKVYCLGNNDPICETAKRTLM